jgi:short-subunit dehydrogenase
MKAIVTGASKGIGKAIAEYLRENYDLFLVPRRNYLVQTMDELRQNIHPLPSKPGRLT